MNNLPFRYLAISDQQVCPEPLIERINRLFKLEVPAIQIRDKKMPDKKKFNLIQKIKTKNNLLFINGRFDIARLTGADGIHLTTSSPGLNCNQAITDKNFLTGLSTHTLAGVKNAHAFNFDYLTFGPIWPTPSKPDLKTGDCAGPKKLHKICRKSEIPIFALGGVTTDRIKTCLQVGAYGVAGIRSLFEPEKPENNWKKIKKSISTNGARLSG